jgi:hypothetical protein
VARLFGWDLLLCRSHSLFYLATRCKPDTCNRFGSHYLWQALRTSEITRGLFVAAGTLSLFTIGDFFWFQLGYRVGDLANEGLTGRGLDLLFLVLSAATIAVAIALLGSRFLRSQRWVLWLFAIAGGISLFTLVNYALAVSGASPIISTDSALMLTASPSILYFVVPLGLWYRYGLFRRRDLRIQWPGTRRVITLLYAPTALFDVFALSLEMRSGRLWGLLPYFAGLNLVSLGYLAVAKQTSLEKTQAVRAEETVTNATGIHAT